MVEELYHHGIKGMKWGVRHDKTQTIERKVGFGLSYNDIDKETVKSINSKYNDYSNCLNCSAAYILNTKFNRNVIAKPVTNPNGMLYKEIYKMFDNVNTINYAANPNVKFVNDLPTFKKASNDIKANSSGILFINFAYGGGHYINYESDSNGKITYIDCQTNKIRNKPLFGDYARVQQIFDLTNSTLSNNKTVYENSFEGVQNGKR